MLLLLVVPDVPVRQQDTIMSLSIASSTSHQQESGPFLTLQDGVQEYPPHRHFPP